MALVTDANTSWSDPILLTSDEIWQVRSGSVFVTTTGTPAANDGLALVQGQGFYIRAGQQVRYRKEGTTVGLLVREEI
jgi:hypothetical protein